MTFHATYFLLALTATAGPNCTQVGQSFNPIGHSRTYPVAASASLNGPTQQLHSPVRASDRLPRRQGASRDEITTECRTIYFPKDKGNVQFFYELPDGCAYRDTGELIRLCLDMGWQKHDCTVLQYEAQEAK